MRWAIAAILLLTAMPPPSAQAASWSIDAVLAVRGDTVADYSWRVAGLSNTRLTLPLPDNATFLEARDDDGKKLSASADAHDVEVTAGSRPFEIRFRVEGRAEGPFVLFPAQVASAADSPVTVGLTLPPGWSLAGYRDNEEAAPDARGTFRKTGPSYIQYLVLPPGMADPGPDARVSGDTARREAFANVSADRVEWSVVTTYDADVYSRDWEVHVPAGATVTRAFTPFGPLTTTPSAEGLRLRTPYPVGYGLGGRSFTVEMELPAPTPHGGPFREANLSIRAAEGDVVSLVATLDAGAQYTGARVAGGREVAPLRYEARGPLSVGLGHLPPPVAGHVQMREGLFVVDAPRALESAARATARNVSTLLPHAASFAYDAADTRPFYVAYVEEDIFGWEEGFYSNGLNTISIRASTLEDASDGKAHLVPVGVLVHEATHGLIDRRIPDAPHNLSFLHEGLSRLAETRAELVFSNEVVSCRKTLLSEECERHTARPAADEREPREHDLYRRYRSGASFDIAWSAGSVGDDERGALYDLSGLVLHAYTQRAPPGALENALVHIARTSFPGPDTTDAALITEILRANAPGTSAQALLYPGAEARELPIAQFRHCLGTLLAPPYAWEESRNPPGGCPATGYGPRHAALPPPPTTPTVATQPVTTSPPAPPPRISPPITATPDGESDGGAGELPGAVVDDAPRDNKPGVEVEIPQAPVVAVLALVVLLAAARRR